MQAAGSENKPARAIDICAAAAAESCGSVSIESAGEENTKCEGKAISGGGRGDGDDAVHPDWMPVVVVTQDLAAEAARFVHYFESGGSAETFAGEVKGGVFGGEDEEEEEEARDRGTQSAAAAGVSGSSGHSGVVPPECYVLGTRVWNGAFWVLPIT